MKQLTVLFAFSTVLACGATARAADIVEAPAVYDWTGFYIGGNLGYAFGGDDKVGLQSSGLPSSPDFGINDIDKLELNGFFGGGQIGADWQWNSLVLGAIADVEGSTTYDDFTETFVANTGADLKVHASDDIDWWGTVRGRLGWAFDRVLIYGTGGLAWADIDYDTRGFNLDSGLQFDARKHDTRLGYAVGGGLAWGIDENWSVGAEYLYVNFGKYSVKGRVVDALGKPTGEQIETQATPDF